MKEEMQIAVVEQLPKITEKIKEVGAELDKRLEDLNLNSLVCSEETRKSIKELRTKLGAELKDFERQRKDIKEKINAPYDLFNKTYEAEIKSKYQQADLTLKTKIDEVEDSLKEKAKKLQAVLDENEIISEYKEDLRYSEISNGIAVKIIVGSLEQGYESYEANILVIVANDLISIEKRKRRKASKLFNEAEKIIFSELKQGDYVVHKIHGIGQFVGVNTIVTDKTTKDYIKIKYKNDDMLYVPTDQLDNVKKYIQLVNKSIKNSIYDYESKYSLYQNLLYSLDDKESLIIDFKGDFPKLGSELTIKENVVVSANIYIENYKVIYKNSKLSIKYSKNKQTNKEVLEELLSKLEKKDNILFKKIIIFSFVAKSYCNLPFPVLFPSFANYCSNCR